MCFPNSNGAAQAAQKQQQAQLAQISQATNQINQAFSGFTPQFYQNRVQAYENYAEPQLIQQYQQAGQGLLDKLGNQGLLNSSAALQEKGALGQAYNQAQQQVANTGIGQSQQLQQQVAGQQANLIGQANAAANPLSIAQGAATTAGSYAAPSAFAPVGNLFSQFGQTYLGNQLNSTYNPNLYSYFLNPNSQQNQGLGASQSIFGG